MNYALFDESDTVPSGAFREPPWREMMFMWALGSSAVDFTSGMSLVEFLYSVLRT